MCAYIVHKLSKMFETRGGFCGILKQIYGKQIEQFVYRRDKYITKS